jgi:predicted pyridoxine 5'-phosphate oxidase superfamily flavin-nucleotide-binding protein
MISSEVKQFIEGRGVATVASADASGQPHLAIGNDIRVADDRHILFENWFCQSTLRNIEQNRQISVAVTARDGDYGYQFIGTVVHGFDVAILDGNTNEKLPVGDLQALSRLVIRVERVLPFCSGLHSDLHPGE